MRRAVCLIALTACGRVGFDSLADGDISATDACASGPWGMPVLVPELSSDSEEYGPIVSSDGRTIIFTSDRPGGLGGLDLWMATRPVGSQSFDAPTPLVAINSAALEGTGSLSADGLTLYFSSERAGPRKLFTATRASTSDEFAGPTEISGLPGSFVLVDNPKITLDGKTLYFDADGGGGAGGTDIWFVTRADPTAPWSGLKNLSSLNTASAEGDVAFEPDELTVYFVSNRLEAPLDTFVATRPDRSADFGPAMLRSAWPPPGVGEYGIDVSRDGTTMILAIHLGAPLMSNLWIATRSCL